MVKDSFSFTQEGLRRVRLAGFTPGQVWAALHSEPRMIRQLSDRQMSVFARAGLEHVVVALEESPLEDNDWDIVGARRMDQREREVFNKLIGRMP